MRCDFCLTRDVAWCHHCDPFTLDWYVDDGRWAACSTCHELVLARDEPALAARCGVKLKPAEREKALDMLAAFLAVQYAHHPIDACCG